MRRRSFLMAAASFMFFTACRKEGDESAQRAEVKPQEPILKPQGPVPPGPPPPPPSPDPPIIITGGSLMIDVGQDLEWMGVVSSNGNRHKHKYVYGREDRQITKVTKTGAPVINPPISSVGIFYNNSFHNNGCEANNDDADILIVGGSIIIEHDRTDEKPLDEPTHANDHSIYKHKKNSKIKRVNVATSTGPCPGGWGQDYGPGDTPVIKIELSRVT